MNKQKFSELFEAVTEAQRQYTDSRYYEKESTQTLETMDQYIDELIVEHIKHVKNAQAYETMIENKKRQRETHYLEHQKLALARESRFQELERAMQRLANCD
jgi:putative protein kinase ArgK-like GTPase of G3E family